MRVFFVLFFFFFFLLLFCLVLFFYSRFFILYFYVLLSILFFSFPEWRPFGVCRLLFVLVVGPVWVCRLFLYFFWVPLGRVFFFFKCFVVHFVLFFSGMAPVWGVSSFVCFGCGSRLGVSSFFVLFFLVPLGRVFFDVLLSILFFFFSGMAPVWGVSSFVCFGCGSRLGVSSFFVLFFLVPLGRVFCFFCF